MRVRVNAEAEPFRNLGALPVSNQTEEEWTHGLGLITTLTPQTSMN